MITFIAGIIGLGILLYLDKGKFWDIVPYVSIPAVILSLIFGIFNFIRKTGAGLIFIFFFIIFSVALMLSSIFGPFALNRRAQNNMESNYYSEAINNYDMILENYPDSIFSSNALENLPYAYFYDGNFIESLKSFEIAIANGLIDYSDLGIKRIFSEIYPKIAEGYDGQKNYREAAQNYLNAVLIFEEIKNDFPDTNEAFIADYKIPEYLYMASVDFQRNRDFLEQIESLERIIKDYSNSDYYAEAEKKLFDAYVNSAIDLSDNSNYLDAVDQVLKMINLEDFENLKELLEQKEKSIFNNMPPNILQSRADQLYYKGSYPEAFYLYNIILDYHPQLESAIIKNMIESKIKLASMQNYQDITPAVRGQWFNSQEISILMIENKTLFKLTIYLKGPEYKIIKVDKESTEEFEIAAGDYTELAELDSQENMGFMGNATYEPGRKYREIYEILEKNSQDED